MSLIDDIMSLGSNSPLRLSEPAINPVRTDAKRLFKFDIGDLVEVKYKHPRPQNNIQKQLVGKKLKGLVMNFQVFNFQVSLNESILLYYGFLSLRFVFCRFRSLAKVLMVN